jgi:hypothetical protein
MGTDRRFSGRAQLGHLTRVLACAAILLPGAVHAETKDKKPAAAPKSPITMDESAKPQMPDAYKLNMLIRTTLIALNQANQTGNYSVLRDLGTPQFQALNSDAKLAEIFAGLRGRKLDMSPVLFFDPKLIREPALQPGGLLRLTGYIPTDPQRILFDMGFERVDDQWRLAAIVIDVQPAPATPPAAKAPAKDAKGSMAKTSP